VDKFIIEGRFPLKGEVTPAGNKNAALPLLAACLMTDEPVIIRNIPNILDVETMRRLMESMGGLVRSRYHAQNSRLDSDCRADVSTRRRISPATTGG